MLSSAPVVLGAALTAGLTAALVLGVTGALAPVTLGDPGAGVRWGLPAVRALHHVAAAATVGLLLLAAVAIPPGPGADGTGTRQPSPGWHRAVRLAAGTSALWTLSALALLVLTYASVAGTPLNHPSFGPGLWLFLTAIPTGQALAATVGVAAVVSTGCVGATRLRGAAALTALALAGLAPLALSGHAAGAADHETAVTSLALHLVGVCLWFGGLMALVLVRPALGGSLADVARRYSATAAVGFALVAGSGVVNGWVQLGGLSAVGGLSAFDGFSGLGGFGTYGLLLAAKTAALLLLGAAGFAHRRRLLPGLGGTRTQSGRAFWRLVAGELVVMAAATGLAVALSRTATPAAGLAVADPTPAELVTGSPLPPPLTFSRWFTEWSPDLLWVLVAVAAAGWYLAALVRLRRRGDRWPVHRTTAWLLGCLALLLVTSAGPVTYGRVLFSAHMLQHMTLSMIVPPLLVVGAPVTLALRTLGSRGDGSRGPREWLLAVVHSRYLQTLGSALVAAGLFAGSLVAFYYTPLFGLALRSHVGHELMTLHFLATGYLFASVLIGTDPGPRRPPYPLLLLLLFATMAFHAFFGTALMAGEVLLAGEYFQALGRDWGRPLLADQQYGGALAWGIGEIPVLVLALVVALQWARQDGRESRRGDRSADRDGDAELARYNAYLAGLQTGSGRGPQAR